MALVINNHWYTQWRPLAASSVKEVTQTYLNWREAGTIARRPGFEQPCSPSAEPHRSRLRILGCAGPNELRDSWHKQLSPMPATPRRTALRTCRPCSLAASNLNSVIHGERPSHANAQNCISRMHSERRPVVQLGCLDTPHELGGNVVVNSKLVLPMGIPTRWLNTAGAVGKTHLDVLLPAD